MRKTRSIRRRQSQRRSSSAVASPRARRSPQPRATGNQARCSSIEVSPFLPVDLGASANVRRHARVPMEGTFQGAVIHKAAIENADPEAGFAHTTAIIVVFPAVSSEAFIEEPHAVERATRDEHAHEGDSPASRVAQANPTGLLVWIPGEVGRRGNDAKLPVLTRSRLHGHEAAGRSQKRVIVAQDYVVTASRAHAEIAVTRKDERLIARNYGGSIQAGAALIVGAVSAIAGLREPIVDNDQATTRIEIRHGASAGPHIGERLTRNDDRQTVHFKASRTTFTFHTSSPNLFL